MQAPMNILKVEVGRGRQETGVERSRAMGELSFHSQHNANRNAPGGGALAFSFPIVQVAKQTGDPKSRLQEWIMIGSRFRKRRQDDELGETPREIFVWF